MIDRMSAVPRQSVWRRGSEDAWRRFSHPWAIVSQLFADIVFGVVTAFVFATQTEVGATGAGVLGAGGAAVGQVTQLILLLIYSWSTAALSQRNESWAIFDEIIAARVSPLQLTPRHGRALAGEHPHKFFAELDIYNASDFPISNVVVRALDLIQDGEWNQETGEREYVVFAFTPANLAWSPGEAQSGDMALTLPAKSARTILVAYSDAAPEWGATLGTAGTTRIIHANEHRLIVRVDGDDVGTIEESFLIHPHPQEAARANVNGREVWILHGGRGPAIEFEPWEPWWTERKGFLREERERERERERVALEEVAARAVDGDEPSTDVEDDGPSPPAFEHIVP